RDLVIRGITTKEGENEETKKQSKHFVCTSCHNLDREDPDLTQADPEARLSYVKEKGMPFLQGTSLYGVINRTSYYNGDYEKKYGKLVYNARNDLREAIQLCAVECAQGRRLQSWELESILAYLWTIGLQLDDLNLDQNEKDKLKNARIGEGDKTAAIEMIKSHYLQASPATFGSPPEDRKEGYDKIGNPDNGRLIYDLSCQHCHERSRYSFFNLDDATLTFKYLERHLPKYTRYSIYQVGRYGTPPLNGKRAYMPQYTLEKMSNQQMEDLRSFIEQEASGF
ncbi:MAG: cytochrome c, partial [Saprospiraceae bacterium]|nr:cytochrome c [Saprospiraceae bacterium]